MCGIGALYSAHGNLSAETLLAVRKAVGYRGPDDEGVACFPVGGQELALVHQRLSILDLTAAGRQPMAAADRGCWITYNGEIYNYLELREELRAAGHAFATQSDTEVILAAYRQWGRDCLHRFNGMFAFVLYDSPRRRLFAARDRFGVKPLYYWISPEGLVAFASEIKQFAALPGWRARVNGQRAYDFLNWGLTDHTDETLFEGVFQLRGGEAVALELSGAPSGGPGGRLPAYRWYDLEGRSFSGTLAQAGEEFRRLLTDSVRLRLRSDVPVGTCLSGGLDSSSIVCVMNEVLDAHGGHALQKTFSACSTVARYDERRYIDEVVRHTAVDAHYVYPGLDGLFELLDRITWHQDEPFQSTSVYAQWHVFQLAAQNGIKVMLDGQGADEQLAGYHGFFGARYGDLLRGLRWGALWKEALRARELHGHSPLATLARAANAVLPEPVRQPLRRLAGLPAADAPWLDLAVLRADPIDPVRATLSRHPTAVAGMVRSQLTAASLPMLLHWEDRNSMAHSVEARLPFLDYRLVEFVIGLPDDYKVAGGMTKRVLREGMRGVLPESIRSRVDKLGFATPEDVWIREQGAAQFRKALGAAVESSGGILRPRALDAYDRSPGGPPSGFPLWRMISFGAWMRVFSVSP